MNKFQLAVVYVFTINIIANFIITIYLDKILKKMDKSSNSRIGIGIIYPLLGSVAGPILIIFFRLL
ncbi:hypothetical protein [Clostridium sp. UBA5712]|uniref:hypothetical protein n=1 Tax=Clostridium sp. UBA5712 TaxID=1946368 RepID=UPI003217FC28